ncbi:YebC/PmpR family DNA-binding transcriptional regulator [Aminithiophilus ramosus]|uniref:YebC/PmpR family DNA-binding transcriptional regulator n=2 Tax=Synergistales TaxID=649776 RepID=A0ACD1DZB4_9BACT|nr:YebC/PmpR family DNA-binding transcriptional regulator [Aminithiophilus ramosus]QTX33581.1 YebC/PmpR family DNA-binding transcriptional regulator [Aminithiophilus ramosus]QVL37435.1 YebC/PmpR family DNA-binding transcriptional regulator [Synergistota bacterium]
MSGHSKWANIKHRKAAQDAKKGVAFQKLVRAIMVAAKEGGADLAMNIRLKTFVDKAKEANMTNETIDRAIKKGSGGLDGENYEELYYEGYGPGGVAVLVESLTDNKNRTSSEVRFVFSRNGGSLGEAGCVAWMFERRGVIVVSGEGLDEDELMMNALDGGADDVENNGDGTFSIYCTPSAFSAVRETLSGAGYHIASSDVQMTPKNTVTVSERGTASRLLRLLDALEDLDDVQNVTANFDIPDEVMESLEA